MGDTMEIIVGITGASGGPVVVKVIESLIEKGYEIGLIASENGRKVMKFETGRTPEDYGEKGVTIYENNDLSSNIASGTVPFEAVIIVPCSTSTLAKINCGIADNLITRVAAVAIKERRRLVLVPRETPLSPIALKNMKELAEIGTIILPPMMEFYTRPKTIDDMVSFTAGRILDSLGMEHDLYPEWRGEKD